MWTRRWTCLSSLWSISWAWSFGHHRFEIFISPSCICRSSDFILFYFFRTSWLELSHCWQLLKTCSMDCRSAIVVKHSKSLSHTNKNSARFVHFSSLPFRKKKNKNYQSGVLVYEHSCQMNQSSLAATYQTFFLRPCFLNCVLYFRNCRNYATASRRPAGASWLSCASAMIFSVVCLNVLTWNFLVECFASSHPCWTWQPGLESTLYLWSTKPILQNTRLLSQLTHIWTPHRWRMNAQKVWYMEIYLYFNDQFVHAN
jgi:hypothetical protein